MRYITLTFIILTIIDISFCLYVRGCLCVVMYVLVVSLGVYMYVGVYVCILGYKCHQRQLIPILQFG